MPNPLTSPDVSIISEMITPALFIVASGSLLGAALARLARIVDYFRKLSGAEDAASDQNMAILQLVEKRADLAEATVAMVCFAIMAFVLTCFLIAVDRWLNHTIYLAPVAFAIIGVLLLLVASVLMVVECRMGQRQLRSEIAGLRSRHA